jgi:hypothetical protein
LFVLQQLERRRKGEKLRLMPATNEANTSISKEEFLQMLQRNDYELDGSAQSAAANCSYGSVASAVQMSSNHTPLSANTAIASTLITSGSRQSSNSQYFFGADFALPCSSSAVTTTAIQIDNRVQSGPSPFHSSTFIPVKQH